MISPGTAKLHVHRVITKLWVSDRTQAAIYAIKSGFFELEERDSVPAKSRYAAPFLNGESFAPLLSELHSAAKLPKGREAS